MKNYVIKNNIVLFSRSCLSQWYGAFNEQENGQFWWKPLYFLGEAEKVHFNCAEQAMMVAKALISQDKESVKQIMKESHPAEQKALGRKIKNFDDNLWNTHKFDIVSSINLAKFSQNPELKELLTKELQNYIIAEATSDRIWGIGLAADDEKAWDVITWEGQNLLGKALMSVREKLNY